MTDTHCARLGPESLQHMAEGRKQHLVFYTASAKEDDDDSVGWAGLFVVQGSREVKRE